MDTDAAESAARRLRRRLEERGWAMARIDGDSMEPTLTRGDTVRVEIPGGMQPGDVVTFERHGRLFTHRIVRLTGDMVYCRGDNSVWADPGVPRSQIVGQVTEIVGRGALPAFHATFSRVGLRRALRRNRIRGRHLGDELSLVWRQSCRGAVARRGGLAPFGVPNGEPSDGAYVLTTGDVETRQVVVASGVVRIIVPAGIYSRLSRDARVELLPALDASQVVVLALPRRTMGHLPRMLGLARRAARRIGLEIGSDGDAVIPSGSALRPGYVHYFRAEEMADELNAALPGRLVVVSSVATASGQLLLGVATRR